MDHGLSGACTIRPLPLISDIAAAPDVQAQLPLIDLGQGEVAPADELPIGDPWSRQADIDRGPVQIGRAVQMQALTVDPDMVDDDEAQSIGTITLSYTFYSAKPAARGASAAVEGLAKPVRQL